MWDCILLGEVTTSLLFSCWAGPHTMIVYSMKDRANHYDCYYRRCCDTRRYSLLGGFRPQWSLSSVNPHLYLHWWTSYHSHLDQKLHHCHPRNPYCDCTVHPHSDCNWKTAWALQLYITVANNKPSSASRSFRIVGNVY